MALPATDNFNAADQDPITGNWTTSFSGFGQMRRRLNQIINSTASAGAYWNADTFAGDHYAEAKPVSLNNDGAGPGVRIQTSGTQRNCYFLANRLSSIQRLYKIVNNTLTQLGSDYTPSPSLVSGTTKTRLRVSGTTLTISNDGVDLSPSQTDATHSGGAAGYIDINGQFHDDWEGGNVGSAASIVPRVMFYRRILSR